MAKKNKGSEKCRMTTVSPKLPKPRRPPTYRELLVQVGQALSKLPTLLPRAPFYMCQHERELNEKIVDPYYGAIARARGIILFESEITEKEMESPNANS